MAYIGVYSKITASFERCRKKTLAVEADWMTQLSAYAYPHAALRIIVEPIPNLISDLGKSHIVFMYHRQTLVSLLRLWMLVRTFTTSALAIASQGTVLTATNQTHGKPNPNLTNSKYLINDTLTPPQNFISYHVPNSPTTLLLHHLGPTIPLVELLQTVALAVEIIYKGIGEGRGRTPIANHGYFDYSHEFLNHDEIEIIVADFREMGKAMSYYVLFDVVRGAGQFMISPEQHPRELDFEVEVEEVGYVGTGHVSYKKVETSASSVA